MSALLKYYKILGLVPFFVLVLYLALTHAINDHWTIVAFSLMLAFLILGFYQEIASKTTSEELRENLLSKTEELNFQLQIIDEYVIMSKTDTRGIITYASEAFCKISKYSKTELIGKSHNLVRSPDEPKELFAYLWSIIQEGGTWSGEIKNKTKQGSAYWTQTTISPEYNNHGKKIGYIAIRYDITDKKLAEFSHTQLVAQSRSAAMGEMISMIAHQWRQPLASINAIAGNLLLKQQLGTIGADEFQKGYEEIVVLTQHLSSTVEDFRNFFKPNKEKRDILTAEIVDTSLKILNPLLISNAIEIGQEIRGYFVHAHENELKQVLINIIKNAADQLISQGVETKIINIKDYEEGRFIVIEVGDNGGGIPEDILPKIFDPYFSTKARNGTGLGLYISKTIIESHLQGELQATNGVNGAIFKIKIPTIENT